MTKLLDFGLVLPPAWAVAHYPSEEGQILGTPLFMSPEQAMCGRQLDGRSDILERKTVPSQGSDGVPPSRMLLMQSRTAKLRRGGGMCRGATPEPRGGDRSPVEGSARSSGIGHASAYMPVAIIVVDAPMPAKVAWVELIEPIEDIDMPVVELMPVMVDAGLMVPDIDDPAGLPKENDIVRPDPDANERETIIPAGI